MDADDMCSPARIEKQLDLLNKNNEVDVVGCGVVYLSDKDDPLGYSVALRNHEEICRKPYRGFGICHASIVARKSWCRKFRYDESIHLGQDFNLWLRSYNDSKFANIPEPLYYYRLESSYNLKKQCKDRYMSSIYLFEYHKKRDSLCKGLFYFFIQYMKMITEIVFCAIGAKRKLFSRRYSQLTVAEAGAYIAEIQKIKKIELPTVTT